MPSKPWQGKSVVIIDDSPGVRTHLRELFEAIGMVVKGVAENGIVGLKLVAEHKPDFASIDIIMPEMDGVECYRKMQEQHAHVKCMMISWLASDQKIIDSLKDIIPAHVFQAKPVTQAALEDRLDKVINPPSKEAPKNPLDDTDSALRDLGIKVA
jgi:DNA-binding NarL/FixJ family response regulator